MDEQITTGPDGVSPFPVGEPNETVAQHFTGRSYLGLLAQAPMLIANVTFEPGCRTDWHVHRADEGGGQILLVTAGHGRCQVWGGPVRELVPGDVVNTPAGIKHWHGAAPDSWFAHVAIEVPGTGVSTEWLEAVRDEGGSP